MGYSVVQTTYAASKLKQLTCDLLAGTRMPTANIFSRCKAHHLILSVVLERHPPALIALGPSVAREEPEDFVLAMRTMVKQCAILLRVPVIEFEDEEDVIAALNFGEAKKRPRRLNGLVVHHLGKPLQSTDRRVVLATATALAAAIVMNNTTGAAAQ